MTISKQTREILWEARDLIIEAIRLEVDLAIQTGNSPDLKEVTSMLVLTTALDDLTGDAD